MKQIRSQKAMVTGIVALYLSPLASTRKGHRIRDVLKFNSATRIRTWKMLESESSALPFGDSPSSFALLLCFVSLSLSTCLVYNIFF